MTDADRTGLFLSQKTRKLKSFRDNFLFIFT